jgi:hypothetical protein
MPFPDAQEIAGILAQMPGDAKLVFLDSHGTVQPVTTAFDAFGPMYGPDDDTPWADLPVLANDPARILFASTLPEGDKYHVAPQQPDGYTAGQMVVALGSPAPLACDGLFSTLNSGDVPMNVYSPISYVATPPLGDEPPVLVDIHGVYVDFDKTRVLLTAF